MPSNNSSAEVHYLAGRFPNRIGWLIGPSARSKSKLRPWIHYALDNDAFSAWSKGTEWSESEWVAMLNWAKMNAQKPKWAIVPDVVANKQKTLENWKRYSEHLKAYNWPLAFAVQDGMIPDDVPSDADVVFVGGSTAWKWSTAATWARNFKRVHVGRVNSVSKLWYCQDLGIESVDGTGWFRDPSDESKFPAVLDWLSGIRYDADQFNLGI